MWLLDLGSLILTAPADPQGAFFEKLFFLLQLFAKELMFFRSSIMRQKIVTLVPWNYEKKVVFRVLRDALVFVVKMQHHVLYDRVLHSFVLF